MSGSGAMVAVRYYAAELDVAAPGDRLVHGPGEVPSGQPLERLSLHCPL